MSIEDFYRKSREKFLKKIAPIVKNREVSEDLFQDAIVTALEKYHLYDSSRSKEETWFTCILFTKVWNWKRSLKKGPDFVDTEVEEFLDETLSNYEESHENIELKTKNPLHKKIFYLRYILGYSAAEISVLLKLNPENVKKILQRVKKGI